MNPKGVHVAQFSLPSLNLRKNKLIAYIYMRFNQNLDERSYISGKIGAVNHLLLLLCSHSPNDVPPEPQRNVSIAAVRGAVRPSKVKHLHTVSLLYTCGTAPTSNLGPRL